MWGAMEKLIAGPPGILIGDADPHEHRNVGRTIVGPAARLLTGPSSVGPSPRPWPRPQWRPQLLVSIGFLAGNPRAGRISGSGVGDGRVDRGRVPAGGVLSSGRRFHRRIADRALARRGFSRRPFTGRSRRRRHRGAARRTSTRPATGPRRRRQRNLPTASRNAFHIQRLKDKLGNHSERVPRLEIELHGACASSYARARRIASRGRRLRTPPHRSASTLRISRVDQRLAERAARARCGAARSRRPRASRRREPIHAVGRRRVADHLRWICRHARGRCSADHARPPPRAVQLILKMIYALEWLPSLSFSRWM